VLETHSAAEALEIFSKDGEGVQLVLTDMIMPGIGGQELAQELRACRPELRIVFMSGYPNERVDKAGAAFLPKPFNPASLSRMIRKELDRPAVARRRGMKGS
jgi:FixJ family two-component response regulator